MIWTHSVNHVSHMLVYKYVPNGTLHDNLSGWNFVLYATHSICFLYLYYWILIAELKPMKSPCFFDCLRINFLSFACTEIVFMYHSFDVLPVLLAAKTKEGLHFAMRLQIALGSSRLTRHPLLAHRSGPSNISPWKQGWQHFIGLKLCSKGCWFCFLMACSTARNKGESSWLCFHGCKAPEFLLKVPHMDVHLFRFFLKLLLVRASLWIFLLSLVHLCR